MDLASLIAAAREKNPKVVGVAVVNHNTATPAFIALCVNRDGKPCDPRSWETHPTPEGALADLQKQITGG